MKALLSRPAEQKALPRRSRPFSILAVYENAEVRQGALDLYFRLAEESAGKIPFTSAWRSFSELAHDGASGEITRTAMEADVVLIACAGEGEEVPEALTRWMDSWGACRSDEKALVVLVGPDCRPPEPDSAAHHYFARVARKAGMTYFPGHFCFPEKDASFSMEAILARADAHTPTMEGILCTHIPGDHWGINE
jgi:hypothetical protein